MKTAIYSRVSTNKQEVQNQLIELRKYCQKKDWDIYKEYTDTISGKENSRPSFDEMFLEARQRKFDVVLFWSLDRFSRSGTLFTLQKLTELKNLGIKWHSYSEPDFSSLGEFGDVIISVLATLAKIERQKIGQRTIAGLIRAKKNNGGKLTVRGKDKKKRIRRYWRKPK